VRRFTDLVILVTLIGLNEPVSCFETWFPTFVTDVVKIAYIIVHLYCICTRSLVLSLKSFGCGPKEAFGL